MRFARRRWLTAGSGRVGGGIPVAAWLLALACLAAPATAATYGHRVITPTEPVGPLPTAILDLTRTLSQMTGASFAAVEEAPGSAAGIILARTDDDGVPAAMRDRLAQDHREAFVVKNDGDRLWIVANHDKGLP